MGFCSGESHRSGASVRVWARCAAPAPPSSFPCCSNPGNGCSSSFFRSPSWPHSPYDQPKGINQPLGINPTICVRQHWVLSLVYSPPVGHEKVRKRKVLCLPLAPCSVAKQSDDLSAYNRCLFADHWSNGRVRGSKNPRAGGAAPAMSRKESRALRLHASQAWVQIQVHH